MSWDSEYAAGKQINHFPFSDLVSYVMKLDLKPHSRALEFGCGVAQNGNLFSHLDIWYTGIEKSKPAIAIAKKSFGSIVEFDFTEPFILFDKFDLIFDRAAISHNSLEGIKKAMQNVYKNLKPKGYFIGIDWFSSVYSKGLMPSHFRNIDITYFISDTEIYDLMASNGLKILKIEHKIVHNVIKSEITNEQWATYNFIARKI